MQVGFTGFTVEVAASVDTVPRMSRQQAVAVATVWLSQHPATEPKGSALLSGFVVAGATYEADVLKVWENCGAHRYLQTPSNLWVIDLTAPPQLGLKYVRGSVLVDDDTGQAKYADLLTSPTARASISECPPTESPLATTRADAVCQLNRTLTTSSRLSSKCSPTASKMPASVPTRRGPPTGIVR